MRCEDYPCCGHGPSSTGGDSGGCPDEDGRFDCVTCGRKLSKNATSSICSRCMTHKHNESEIYDYPDEGDW